MSVDHVTIFEVGARDGLQNEKRIISTVDKIKLINLLSKTGLLKIEAASFVSPKWVPQMADGADVMDGIDRDPTISYAALVPNIKGFERAITANVDEIAVFASASEAFSQKNINCSIEESIARFRPVVEAASNSNLPVRGYVSCVVGCPYSGDIIPQDVAHVVEAMMALGCYEVSLGDTIGKGTPLLIDAMLDAVLNVTSAQQLAGHYHDTNGCALENIDVSLKRGLRVFDSAVGGLGGCPYAPGAKGNVSTGRVVNFLNDKDISTGIDMKKLQQAEHFVAGLI